MSAFEPGWAEKFGKTMHEPDPKRKPRHKRQHRPGQHAEAGKRGSARGQLGAKIDRVLGPADEV